MTVKIVGTSAPVVHHPSGPDLTEVKTKVADRHLLSVWRKNDSGQVEQLVKLLRQAEARSGKKYLPEGYEPKDGKFKFDKTLVAAVTQFQEDNDLTVDGVVGQQTWGALMGAERPNSIPPGTDWLVAWNALSAEQRHNWNDGFVSELPDYYKLGKLPDIPADALPMYRQGDARWGGRQLGTSSSIRAQGCALTSTAMALSGIVNKEVRPDVLDDYLDKHRGYHGNLIDWDRAARMVGCDATRHHHISLSRLDEELRCGRPVVMGVDYKNGSDIDHWITVKAKVEDSAGNTVYIANDPATGAEVKLYKVKNELISITAGGISKYHAKGMVTFRREGQPEAAELNSMVAAGRSRSNA